MKRIKILTAFFFFSVISTASAADVMRHLDIENALQSVKVQNVLLPEVKLYFAGDKLPEVEKNFGTVKTSKRTNSFMKDKIASCEWAFASALEHLQRTALNHSADAVIEITSNIKNRKNASNVQYDCLVGSMMVNVAFQAKLVKLAQ